MPKLIGKSTRVVEHDGMSIDELVGNVATSEDRLSIARVICSEPASEPWLTLHYDEWMCILKGKIDLHYIESESNTEKVLTATAGETLYIAKGERFRPIFPDGNTEYIPVCIPAFKPERCIREEGETKSQVSERLSELHNSNKEEVKSGDSVSNNKTYSEKIYHMCEKSLWDDAVKGGNAYYPPTFETDGDYTHATAVPERLIVTANHFYTATIGEWICLELSTSTLKDKAGIITRFEEPKPVGEKGVPNNSDKWICPHIFGGIPTSIDGIVTKTFPMKRDDKGTFLLIEGLTE